MPEVLDADWIDDYRKWSSYPNLIEPKLRSDGAANQRELFINSEFQINPSILPEVDRDKIAKHDAALSRLSDHIGEQEEQAVVRDAYLPRIAELRNNLVILTASADGDTDTFVHANVTEYGEPRAEVVGATLSFFHDFINTQISEGVTPLVRKAARRAQDTLPAAEQTGMGFGVEATDFEQVQGLYSDFYGAILEGISIPAEIKGYEALTSAQKALDNIGLPYRAVPQREGVSTMSIDHPTQQLRIPLTEVYTRKRFIGLLGHEGRIHIEERLNGEKQPLKIMFSGLAQYLRGSEGKGVMSEQVLYSSMEEFMGTKRFFDIARRYLSIGLARGVDGGGPRDFKEVFSIMNNLDFLWELRADPENPDTAIQKAIDRTWELLAMRTMRGWTGRGAASFKDKIYLEGNIDQWQLLGQSPGIFPYLNLGKYDASNPEHIVIMEKIGALPHGVVGSSRSDN